MNDTLVFNMTWSPSETERYQRCEDATRSAVRNWQKVHSDRRPTIGWDRDVDLIVPLSDALKQDGKRVKTPSGASMTLDLQLNTAARELARYVARAVPDVSWMIFQRAWEQIYAQSN